MDTITMKVNKDITISGSISGANGEGTIVNIVYLSARISTQGGQDAISQTIQDKAAYNANKAAVRAKIAEFNQIVFEAQDSIINDNEDEGEEEE